MMLSEQHNWSEEEKKKFLTEIAHKAHHLEELIKDLNLSFQMDCLRIPLSGQTSDIVEFVRRIVADVASDPRASKHALDFAALEDRIEAVFDQKLLRRSAIGSFLTGVCVLIILRKH